MTIKHYACAGTMESSDVYIEIEPSGEGISIDIESVVKNQFGESIKKAVTDVLAEQGITDAVVRVKDRGALECVIKARVETAVLRGREDA